VVDATNSPGCAHQHGLQRMQSAGVLLSDVKSLYYEWVRTVKRAEELGEKCRDESGLPEGITL